MPRGHGWTQQYFIEKVREIHGSKFDYSLIIYKNQTIKVDVICLEHGKFSIRAENLLKSRYGCPKCGNKAGGLNNPRRIKDWDNYKDYKKRVLYYTELSFRLYKNEIDPCNKRGVNYHLDHILPISFGYKNNIIPEVIGHPNNLKLIDKLSNLKKSNSTKHLPLFYINFMKEMGKLMKEIL